MSRNTAEIEQTLGTLYAKRAELLSELWLDGGLELISTKLTQTQSDVWEKLCAVDRTMAYLANSIGGEDEGP